MNNYEGPIQTWQIEPDEYAYSGDTLVKMIREHRKKLAIAIKTLADFETMKGEK